MTAKRTTPPQALIELREIDQWVAYSATKIPIAPNGTEASSTNPATWGSLAEAKFIREVQMLPGVGFVFTESDPYVGIDLDNAIDPATNELKFWAKEIVEQLDSYTEFSPSGLGVHVIVKGETPRRGARRSINDGKLEVYSSARYFTMTGKHYPGSKETIEARNMPEFFAKWFQSTDDKSATTGDNLLIWETPEVEAWLADALNHIDADDYHDWVKVGMAIKSQLGEAGFSVWDQWSAKSEKYSRESTMRKWQNIPSQSSVTIASVVWLAERNGFTMPRSTPHNPISEDWDAWLSRQSAINNGDDPSATKGLGIQFYQFSDVYADQSPYEPNLIEPGVLSTGDILLLFGPPKSMKSFAIIDMFKRFCLGQPWLGLTPTQPMKVVYCQFEVKRDQMRRRIQIDKGLTASELKQLQGRFVFTERFTPILDADFVLQFAQSTLNAIGHDVDVLVLDPIANIYTGESENDNAQMSRFLRQIKILRNAINPNCAIVLVHHANKTAKEDRHKEPFNAARGGSALRGAYDTGMYIDILDEDDPKGRTLKLWFELRNGPNKPPIAMRFVDGRFVEVDDKKPSKAATLRDTSEIGLTIEEDEYAQWIEGKIVSEAASGRYYTATTFAQSFSGFGPGNASESTIKRELQRLATIGRVAYFRHDACIPLHHKTKGGYLCARGMVLSVDQIDQLTGEVIFESKVEINPTIARHPATGDYCSVATWRDVREMVEKADHN